MGTGAAIAEAVAAPISAVGNAINEHERIMQGPQMGQINVNNTEAMSDSIFKSGWRPAFGWTLLFWFNLLMGIKFYAGYHDWQLGITDHLIVPDDVIFFMTINILGFSGLRSLDKWFGK